MHWLAIKNIALLILLLQCYRYDLQNIKSPIAVSLVSMGENDTKSLYTYVVKIISKGQNSKTSTCTGSLLSSAWVLTASHCLQKTPKIVTRFTNYTLYLNIRHQNVYRSVLNKFIYPKYSNIIHKHDIGLLMIEKFELKKYGVLETENPQALIGNSVTYAGFGRISPWTSDITKRGTGKHATVLQLGFGELVKCRPHPVKSQICVSARILGNGSSKIQTTRPGDSGGPCFCKGKILGVLFGNFYGAHDPTSSFTPVYPYLSWINNVMATHNIDSNKNNGSDSNAKNNSILNAEEYDNNEESENDNSELDVNKKLMARIKAKCILAS